MRPPLTMNSIAICAYQISVSAPKCPERRAVHRAWGRRVMAAMAAMLLVACATPQAPTPKVVYDFGPVISTQAPTATPQRPTIALPDIEAGAGLDSAALLYRLQYLDAQQLRPYAQARWSVPPAQIVRTRLRDALSVQGPVLANEGGTPWVLRVELDEFSQLFETPVSSQGLVRLRASLMKNDVLIAQTTVLARSNAPSPDAAGGVRALTSATDDAVGQLTRWLAVQIKP